MYWMNWDRYPLIHILVRTYIDANLFHTWYASPNFPDLMNQMFFLRDMRLGIYEHDPVSSSYVDIWFYVYQGSFDLVSKEIIFQYFLGLSSCLKIR